MAATTKTKFNESLAKPLWAHPDPEMHIWHKQDYSAPTSSFSDPKHLFDMIYPPTLSALYQIEITLSQLRSMSVMIPEVAAVREYLYHYLELLDILPYVSQLARQNFGPEAQLSLEIYRDLETDDAYLTLYIRLDKYDKSTMKRIKEIRREYRGLLAEIAGEFLLTTDFRLAR